jgi:Uma2 family endonuclease
LDVGLPQPQPCLIVDGYLRRERASEERHEFHGEIHATASKSGRHGTVSTNVVVALEGQLKGKPCRAKDAIVRSGPVLVSGQGTHGPFSYSDVVVICGEPEYTDAHRDVILNPAVIVEVLSPSTEAFDRGEKFTRYQTWNPTLTDYLLVAQDRPRIEHYRRQADDRWFYRLTAGLEASVEIASIQCTLRLVDVYDRVAFAEG